MELPRNSSSPILYRFTVIKYGVYYNTKLAQMTLTPYSNVMWASSLSAHGFSGEGERCLMMRAIRTGAASVVFTRDGAGGVLGQQAAGDEFFDELFGGFQRGVGDGEDAVEKQVVNGGFADVVDEDQFDLPFF